MSLVGFRIDDRLLHGQVVENWIECLRPDLVLVASERAAADPLACELYRAALPAGVRLEVTGLAGAAAVVARAAAGRVLVIVGSPADALTLVESGVGAAEITVGGLHHDGERERLLDFIYLNARDREALARLHARGVKLLAQDVPRRRPRDLAPLLLKAGSG